MRNRRGGRHRGLGAGHDELHAEAQPGRLIEIVGAGEFGDRDVVLARDAVQRVAAVDVVDAGRRGRHGDRPHRRCGHRGRGGGCGRTRNDQLLTGRERARSLVAIGTQDLGA